MRPPESPTSHLGKIRTLLRYNSILASKVQRTRGLFCAALSLSKPRDVPKRDTGVSITHGPQSFQLTSMLFLISRDEGALHCIRRCFLINLRLSTQNVAATTTTNLNIARGSRVTHSSSVPLPPHSQPCQSQQKQTSSPTQKSTNPPAPSGTFSCPQTPLSPS